MTEPQPPRAQLDLRRPRDIGGLIGDGFNLYFRQFGTFLLIAAAVVVPVNLVVLGIGLGWLTADYDSTPPVGENLITIFTNLLVAVPLTSAMCIYALLDVADGRRPRAREAIQRGLDVFTAILPVLLMFMAAVILGLLALVIPGLFLAVVLSFWAQATVVDGRRGSDALRRSWELVQGTWWRVAGVTLAANLLVGLLSSVVGAPFLALADSSGHAVFQLVGQTLGGILFAPAAALITTLLYFDQRLRRGL